MSNTSPVLFVVIDQLPYPPRNGITLPIYNYLLGLRKTISLEIFLFHDVNEQISQESLEKNEAIFGKITLIDIERKGKFSRLFNEFSLQDMYQHGWSEVSAVAFRQKYNAYTGDKFLLVSPISAVAKLNAIDFDRTGFKKRIAAVNDCTTSEYYFRGMNDFGGIVQQLKAKADYIRCVCISRIEKKLLAGYTSVALQTQTDINLMGKLVSPEIANKSSRVSNGVPDEYFSLPVSPRKKEIIFVAELSGEYAPIATWLVNELWPEILKVNNQYTLVIIGKGAREDLAKDIAKSTQIKHIVFVDQLIDVYKDAAIALSPVFKGFGLINKTLEAMAAGIPVVGGVAAFNGMDNFATKQHGMACDKPSVSEFQEALLYLMNDEHERTRIGANGRTLVEGQFQWEYAVSSLQQMIDK